MERQRGRPKQVDIRRAISACYYAAFHALTYEASRTLIGRAPKDRKRRSLLRRAATHTGVRDALSSLFSGKLPKQYTNVIAPPPQEPCLS